MTYSIIQESQLEGAHRLDAEYYQSEYLELVENLDKLGAAPVGDIAAHPKRKFRPKKGELFQYIEISGIDLSTGEYDKKEILGEDTPDRAQWVVKQNDVIVSTVRPIRNAVSLIGEDVKNLVCSSGFAVLKSEKVEPEYLFAYLKSPPIVKLLDRKTTATMYPAITIEDLLQTKIYIGDQKFRDEIKSKVIEAQKELENSRGLYSQAEGILLEELGLKNFEPADELAYITSSSDVESTRRADAEYFQPKYKKLWQHLKSNFKPKQLKEVVKEKPQKGTEPGSDSYVEEGTPFIRVGNLKPTGLGGGDQKYLTENMYKKLQKEYQPQKGEVLLTKDAAPGIAYVLKEDEKMIISSGILRVKLQEGIEKEYFVLLLNTLIGKYKTEQDAGGSVIKHWREDQIDGTLIPLISPKKQSKIGNLVRESFARRNKAKELLEEAKRKVEDMIEKGARNESTV